MSMNRRQFMSASLAGLGYWVIGREGIALPEGRVAKPGHYGIGDMHELGRTGIQLSRVGLGTGVHGSRRSSNHTKMGMEKFKTLVQASWDEGVRWFDMADWYGTHEMLLPALAGKPRDQYVIVSKIWFMGGLPGPTETGRQAVERFLRELGTDYIDLVQIHCVTDPNWNTQNSDLMDDLAALKKEGVIRAHGVSCHSHEALKLCIEEDWVDAVHTRVNPYAASMDVRTPEEVPLVIDTIREIKAAGRGVIGMKIIGNGDFSNSDEKRNHSIDFANNLGCLDSMTVGFETPEHVADFKRRLANVKVAPVA